MKNTRNPISSTLSMIVFLSLVVASCNVPAPDDLSGETGTTLPTRALQFTPTRFVEDAQPAVASPTGTSIPVDSVRPSVIPSTLTSIPQLPSGQANRIQFAPNGTYADVEDWIAAGSSKTYTVIAMKGQVMSVSILPQIPEGGWGYIPIQIRGADGRVLCPANPNSECTFWRGVLPASQDYLLTLTPTGDAVDFVLRVAVNPPGKDTQYFQYTHPASGVSLTYTDYFAPGDSPYGNYKTSPELALHLIDSDLYDSTNLSEAYLLVSSTSDPQVTAACTDPNQGGGPEQFLGNEVVNGIAFVHSTSEGAGAGNYYAQEIYRALNKNRCYEVIYFIHYTNIGNYPPGTVTEFDQGALLKKMDDIFATFSIK
jgi:hypothetical protein